MPIFENITQTVGRTPLLKLSRIGAGLQDLSAARTSGMAKNHGGQRVSGPVDSGTPAHGDKPDAEHMQLPSEVAVVGP